MNRFGVIRYFFFASFALYQGCHLREKRDSYLELLVSY